MIDFPIVRSFVINAMTYAAYGATCAIVSDRHAIRIDGIPTRDATWIHVATHMGKRLVVIMSVNVFLSACKLRWLTMERNAMEKNEKRYNTDVNKYVQ
jgi:hypothetical protein